VRDVSFHIPAGTRVGIVGPSGAGQSTIVNLLTRFHDPGAGVMLLDGKDLRDYRLTDLRDQFAIVPQDPQLFSTSIAENIRYGNLMASDAQSRGGGESSPMPRGSSVPYRKNTIRTWARQAGRRS